MLKEIDNQVLSIIIKSIISIIGVVITILSTHIINFIKLKNNELIKNIGITKYNEDKKFALDIWNIVEEHFRVKEIATNVIDNKITIFNRELKRKCPYLTQEEIDFLRQTIAGEINKGKFN
ncbi:hypothetical protein [Clostridium pasteurianum]|uniref:Uncharacterized protein n=1 Tax=Clostridium pasteurianum BC1 TaxID=86416 RepID=R4K806_CLOPA|nr:hypothetical protein [Clostridium pasteurianum]AGK96644.1 hypothetical protein Clopa_1723 [Clostridium pasteurianum BC1]